MKKTISLFLVLLIGLCGCSSTKPVDETENPAQPVNEADNYNWRIEDNVNSLDDELLLGYIESTIYKEAVSNLPEGYYVDSVKTQFISKEYIEELNYNSQKNIFFGYTLSELDSAFEGERYYFTLAEDGSTTVKLYDPYVDDTFDKVLKNVLIGSGVILVCVTISNLTVVGAPAISLILATSAQTGSVMAAQGAFFSGLTQGIMTYAKTGELDEAMVSALVGASVGFKSGAIIGVISGGVSQFINLRDISINSKGLSMDDVAMIQRESGYPADLIKEFHSLDEYKAFKDAGLKPEIVNGRSSLIRYDIDLNYKDEFGRTNLERMRNGISPLDPTGKEYQLHHIGQENNGTLAILTNAEHDNPFLHGFKEVSEIDRPGFRSIRKEFWKTMAKILEGLQ